MQGHPGDEHTIQETPGRPVSKATGTLKKLRSVPPTRSERRRRRQSLNEVKLWQLPESTEFSSDPEIMDVVGFTRAIIELEKSHPQLFGPLTEMLPEPSNAPVKDGEVPAPAKRGAPRMAGDWRMLYLAFVLSRDPAMMSFYNRYLSSGIFEACGFEHIPCYSEFALRIKEIEGQSGALEQTANLFIRQARRHEKRIGQIVLTDATSWESDARLEHCCPDPAKCKALWEKQKKTGAAQEIQDASTEYNPLDDADAEAGETSGKAAPEKKGKKAKKKPKGKRPPRYLRRAFYERVQAERHKEAGGEELEDGELPDSVVVPVDETGRFRYYAFKGHLYRSRDPEAGLRRYDGARNEWWHGGYLMPAIDAFVGSPIAVTAFAADEQEYDHYPEINDKVVAAIGDQPLVWSLDRGTGISGVYEFNTRRGAATVAPWKKRRGKKNREDMRTDLYDEHGIPRCPYCGGEGDVDSAGMGLYFDHKNDPRLRFRCVTPHITECTKIHSIACSKEWSLLVPLSRKTELYYAVRRLHGRFESIFDHWRDRYCAAGKNASSRLKRLGVEPQLARAHAGLLLEWIRLCLRHGWVGSWKKRNEKEPFVYKAAAQLERVLKARMKRMLDLPYGAAAEKLKLHKGAQGRSAATDVARRHRLVAGVGSN
jgi:hypothetical protein